MDKILLIESSGSSVGLIQQRLSTLNDVEVIVAGSLAEAIQKTQNGTAISLALLDRNLADAPNGEALDAMVAKGVPSIIFTDSANGAERADFYERGAIDYVIKDGPGSLDYIGTLANRALHNRGTKALVVDDSGVARRKTVRILKRFQLDVLEASNGLEALTQLGQHPDIRLIVTDFDMPVTNGLEVIKTVRKDRSPDELAIIGVSEAGKGDLSARFIKMGANDFIGKPFSEEEFICRVTQNLDRMDQVAALKAAASKDLLTGLFNRSFFFEAATPNFAQAHRQDRNLALAVIQIDKFKQVNEAHGHDGGDKILKEIARALKERARDADILACMGGEEFCLLLFDADPESLADIAADLLERIATCDIEIDGTTVNVTASIGLCAERLDSLEEMIARADALRARAKESGRNRALMAKGHSRGETIKGPTI